MKHRVPSTATTQEDMKDQIRQACIGICGFIKKFPVPNFVSPFQNLIRETNKDL